MGALLEKSFSVLGIVARYDWLQVQVGAQQRAAAGRASASAERDGRGRRKNDSQDGPAVHNQVCMRICVCVRAGVHFYMLDGPYLGIR